MLGATTRSHLLPCSQDNILNQPWSDWDEDQFMGIANHDDIYVFVDNALLPALLQATHSRLHRSGVVGQFEPIPDPCVCPASRRNGRGAARKAQLSLPSQWTSSTGPRAAAFGRLGAPFATPPSHAPSPAPSSSPNPNPDLHAVSAALTARALAAGSSGRVSAR